MVVVGVVYILGCLLVSKSGNIPASQPGDFWLVLSKLRAEELVNIFG